MKPLRFLSLSLAFGLGGMLFALPAHGKAEDDEKKCVENFESELKKFSRMDLTKMDALAPARCAASTGATNDKIETADSRAKLKLSQGDEAGTEAEGACRASYESATLVLEKLLAGRKEVCRKIHAEISGRFSQCLGSKPPESCRGDLGEMEKVYTDGESQFQKDIDASVSFLKKHSDWNKQAERKFRSDLGKLQSNRNTEALSSMPSLNTVDATAQGCANLQEYLNKLEKNSVTPPTRVSQVSGGNEPMMSPIQEQKEAESFVASLSKKLNELKTRESRALTAKRTAFREGLLQKLDSAGGGSTLGNVVKYGGATAPLAGALLQNNNGTTSSIAAGSSGALPALAMMGAAGAAGIAMGQKSGSSAGLGSSVGQVDGPVMTPNNDKASGTEFGGSEANQAAATPSPSPENPTGTNNESKGSGNAVEASNGALAAALGGGASLMPGADKSKPKRDVASTAAGASGGEEALSSFTGSLRPSPRPSSSSDSAGNDVSNLLGRMKDLFKMDDTFGGDMPPDTYAGGPANGAPMSGPSGGEEYTGEESSGGEEYQAGGEYGDEGSEETYQGASPMGDIEVTLFRRVHARHVKCMEKGLVLLLSQELPE